MLCSDRLACSMMGEVTEVVSSSILAVGVGAICWFPIGESVLGVFEVLRPQALATEA